MFTKRREGVVLVTSHESQYMNFRMKSGGTSVCISGIRRDSEQCVEWFFVVIMQVIFMFFLYVKYEILLTVCIGHLKYVK